MTVAPISVTSSGAVLLGEKVTCDGFVFGWPLRVQSHIHLDHMTDFDTSKGEQNILLSEATKELLVVEFDADLPFRQNLWTVNPGDSFSFDDIEVMTLPNGHMLGSIQVAVHRPNGMRLGYSSDFQWPMEKVMEVDALVVDSTYGSEQCRREYTQDEAGNRFVDLVLTQVRRGPVLIKAHRGTLQRALELLDGQVEFPLVATGRLCREVEVYRRFGYSIGALIPVPSDEARAILEGGRYIRFFGVGENPAVSEAGSVVITLSAYMSSLKDPVLEYSQWAYRVALSNHADFDGTLEYVAATGAREVVTDNTRGGHAVELALALRRRLGIDARPSSIEISRFWGDSR